MKKLTAVIIGAGSRGMAYSDIMRNMSDKFEVVAVAEPIDSRRNHVKNHHNLSDDACFTDWKPIIEKGKIADIAVIATMDRDHYDVAIAALSAGYDLLLEKPIAPTPEECKKITDLAIKNNRKVVICTVLRYTAIFNAIKDIIDSGKIGKVVSITHEECVGNVHQSHSFVRGNWCNEEESSSMLLQKCCHDIDLLSWLINKKCKKVQSFGALTYFCEDNAPKDAPLFCIDGCPHAQKCLYNAVKLYYDDKENLWFRGNCTQNPNPSDEEVEKALRETRYGKCVYKCGNNVVDHQTVNMLFEDDITVTLSMNAFNKGGRRIHIMGTMGEITSNLDEKAVIKIYSFDTKETEEINTEGKDGIVAGHGGGDAGIIRDLYEYLMGTYKGKSVPEIDESFDNHLTVFAAEEARRTGTIVDVCEYAKKFGR